MRKKTVQLAAICLALALLNTFAVAVADPQPSQSEPPAVTEAPETETPETGESAAMALSQQIIRIGLYYGSTALDGAKLSNAVGSGYELGYYDSSNQFVRLGYTDQTDIATVKTENVYYGVYENYANYYDHLTSSPIAVGCYHLQLEGSYAAFEEAYVVAAQYEGGFVAWIDGTYYVRVGNYLNRDSAAAAQTALAQGGISTSVAGTSAYGVSVVITGTNKIVFQYDDNGLGTGLGIVPMATAEGQKCVTWFKNYQWYGGFRYERVGGGDLTVVNMVAVDDYIKGVVPHEMSNSWPLEALKAQAVCARNYALYNLGKHRNNHFDLCSSTDCQAYSGLNRAGTNSDLAVDSTAGVTATYQGKYINCVYYSSNGGASEGSAVVWGGQQATYPYLLGVTDPYEAAVAAKISGYRWVREYTPVALTAALNAKGYNCSTIVSAKIASYTDTGNPKSVTFTDSNGKNYTLTARAMVTTFGLRSYRYTLGEQADTSVIINGETVADSASGLYVVDGNGNVTSVAGGVYVITDSGVSQIGGSSGTASGGVFTLTGSGWGHNVGMSQWGAYAMAQLGYTYDQILTFYYTGITVG